MSMPMLRLVAITVIAAGATPALAFETKDLVGRWGVAAYFDAKDAASTRGAAAAACGQPYPIGQGRNGGATMYAAFTGKPEEVFVEGSRIASKAEGAYVRSLVTADAQSFTVRYTDPEADIRYGTMIFVRCRR